MTTTKKSKNSGFSAIGIIITVVVIVLLIIFAWFLRPWWHGLFMALYTFPIIWESLILALIISGLVLARKKEVITSLITFAIAFSLLILVLSPFQNWYAQNYLAKTLSVSPISELSEIDPEFVRIIPKIVAERYASDALQYPRYTLYEPDIAMIDGKPSWVFALVPDGLINKFKLKNNGALYVDMTTRNKNAKVIEQEMKVGPGMLITDSIYWKIYKQKYWTNLEDLYVVPYNDSLYIAVPYITYDVKFRFPAFYTVPQWGGTILVHPDGEMEVLTSQQAQEHPVLADQKLFPDQLARQYVNSFRFMHGIWNFLFLHKEQLEIADVPTQGNAQPFLVKTKDGLKWFIACEPFGEAHGIFKVYQIDARTGAIEAHGYQAEEMLLGPVKSADYVRKENPIIDWSRMTPVESIPVVLGGTLYWEVRIVPTDGSGVSYVAFVNSASGEVLECSTDKAVKDFLESGIIITNEEPGEGTDEKSVIEEIKEYIERINEKLKSLEKLLE